MYNLLKSNADLVERLVDRGGDDECWLWKGTLAPGGYGFFRVWPETRNIAAHRATWALANGRMPKEGLVIMHSCDNPPCVNPNHLSEGTIRDNNLDKHAKGRHTNGVRPIYRGSKNPSSRLNESDVVEIMDRIVKGDSISSIAEKYGVVKTTILNIKNNKSWKHIPRPEYIEEGWKPTEELYRAMELRREGLSFEEIAEHLGTKFNSIYHGLRKMLERGFVSEEDEKYLKNRMGGKRFMSVHQRRAALKYREMGKTYREIAEIIGVSPQSISYLVNNPHIACE